MQQQTLSTLAQWTGGYVYGDDLCIAQISRDSRQPMQQALYIALRGERFDGHAFVEDAVRHGAVAVLVDHYLTNIHVAQIVVDDTTLALGQIARVIQHNSAHCVFAITGSNGKTTVKMLLHAVLQQYVGIEKHVVYANPGNYNNEIGLPLSVVDAPEHLRFAIYEMGAGKPGDIAYLCQIVPPKIALVNTIAPAHLARMHNLLGIAKTKGAIYQSLDNDGIAVINADNAFGPWFCSTCVPQGCQIISFSLHASSDVRASQVRLRSFGAQFMLCTPWGQRHVCLPLAGIHNIYNALAATTMALAAGVALDAIVEALENVSPIQGRQHTHVLPNGVTVIDDSYNANIGSVYAAIDVLAQCPQGWLVLGDMHELGERSNAFHSQVGARARDAGVARLYTLGPSSALAASAFGKNAYALTQVGAYAELLEVICADLNDIQARSEKGSLTILVKGSRASGMEHIVNSLLKKQGGETDAV